MIIYIYKSEKGGVISMWDSWLFYLDVEDGE